jgi:hypothetical protein
MLPCPVSAGGRGRCLGKKRGIGCRSTCRKSKGRELPSQVKGDRFRDAERVSFSFRDTLIGSAYNVCIAGRGEIKCVLRVDPWRSTSLMLKRESTGVATAGNNSKLPLTIRSVRTVNPKTWLQHKPHTILSESNFPLFFSEKTAHAGIRLWKKMFTGASAPAHFLIGSESLIYCCRTPCR